MRAVCIDKEQIGINLDGEIEVEGRRLTLFEHVARGNLSAVAIR